MAPPARLSAALSIGLGLIGLAACALAEAATPIPKEVVNLPIVFRQSMPTPTGTDDRPVAPTPTPTAEPTTTPTAVATPGSEARFAVIGDYGLDGRPEEAVAELIARWAPDLILTVGDNNYPSGKAETIDDNIGQYYHQFIYPYLGRFGPGADVNRFFPSLGNHDYEYASQSYEPYLDYFTLPGNERYYDFTWGPVHFFALNSDPHEPDGIEADSTQAGWLYTRLAYSSSPWQIVYFHHAPYSSGLHGSTEVMQWPFREWGADVVLAGHDHTYERALIDDFPYFVNGLGGGPRYGFGEPAPGSQARYNADYGALLVDVWGDRIEFSFVTRGGELIDFYVLWAR
jgi:hypothetical protein